jgi:hypothetical protein
METYYKGTMTDAKGKVNNIDVTVVGGHHDDPNAYLLEHTYRGAKSVDVVEVDRAGNPAEEGKSVPRAPVKAGQPAAPVTAPVVNPAAALKSPQ